MLILRLKYCTCGIRLGWVEEVWQAAIMRGCGEGVKGLGGWKCNQDIDIFCHISATVGHGQLLLSDTKQTLWFITGLNINTYKCEIL